MEPEELVIWGDETLLVVNKPAGMPVLPDGYDASAPHIKTILTPVFGTLWIVHRLDRHTSGILILARSAAAHRSLNDQFAAHTIEKIYHALVCGSPAWDELLVDLPLRPNGDRRHRTVIDRQHGKEAATYLSVLKRLKAYTLLQVCPKTGRTHQIRTHLAAVGFPLVADQLYGGALIKGNETTGLLARPALHAWAIKLLHPTNRALLQFEAPYPDDFSQTIEWLSH